MKVSRFCVATLTSIVLATLLLLVPVGTVSAYPYGPYKRTRTVTLVNQNYEEIYRLTLYVEYYDYPYGMDVKVTKVRVTLTFLYDDGYAEMQFVELLVGKEPWNSEASLYKYWGDYHLEQETLVYYGDTKTYQAYPNVFMPLKSGIAGEGGIWKVLPADCRTWRLIADGLHFYASIIVVVGLPVRDQFAMQFHHADPAPLLVYV